MYKSKVFHKLELSKTSKVIYFLEYYFRNSLKTISETFLTHKKTPIITELKIALTAICSIIESSGFYVRRKGGIARVA